MEIRKISAVCSRFLRKILPQKNFFQQVKVNFCPFWARNKQLKLHHIFIFFGKTHLKKQVFSIYIIMYRSSYGMFLFFFQKIKKKGKPAFSLIEIYC